MSGSAPGRSAVPGATCAEADGRPRPCNAALDAGVTFIDTADVYGDGRSEKIVAGVLKSARRRSRPMVATKAGRRLSPHAAGGYTKANLEGFIDRSLKNLAGRQPRPRPAPLPADRGPLPPGSTSARSTSCRRAGKIKGYGVSVATVEEALEGDRVSRASTSIQIIYNIFRQRPGRPVLPARPGGRTSPSSPACRSQAACSSGKITRDTGVRKATTTAISTATASAFDVGETFAGVPFEVGLQAVDQVRKLVPAGRLHGGLRADARY